MRPAQKHNAALPACNVPDQSANREFRRMLLFARALVKAN
jgi:hypothetical protein